MVKNCNQKLSKIVLNCQKLSIVSKTVNNFQKLSNNFKIIKTNKIDKTFFKLF